MQVFEAEQQNPLCPTEELQCEPHYDGSRENCMEWFNQEEIDQLNAKGKFLRAEIEKVFKFVNVPGQVTAKGLYFESICTSEPSGTIEILIPPNRKHQPFFAPPASYQ